MAKTFVRTGLTGVTARVETPAVSARATITSVPVSVRQNVVVAVKQPKRTIKGVT